MRRGLKWTLGIIGLLAIFGALADPGKEQGDGKGAARSVVARRQAQARNGGWDRGLVFLDIVRNRGRYR